eukprot:3140342-Rhodomonas_salina.2
MHGCYAMSGTGIAYAACLHLVLHSRALTAYAAGSNIAYDATGCYAMYIIDLRAWHWTVAVCARCAVLPWRMVPDRCGLHAMSGTDIAHGPGPHYSVTRVLCDVRYCHSIWC